MDNRVTDFCTVLDIRFAFTECSGSLSKCSDENFSPEFYTVDVILVNIYIREANSGSFDIPEVLNSWLRSTLCAHYQHLLVDGLEVNLCEVHS